MPKKIFITCFQIDLSSMVTCAFLFLFFTIKFTSIFIPSTTGNILTPKYCPSSFAELKIAGTSTDFVNKVLEKIKGGNPNGGLEDI